MCGCNEAYIRGKNLLTIKLNNLLIMTRRLFPSATLDINLMRSVCVASEGGGGASNTTNRPPSYSKTWTYFNEFQGIITSHTIISLFRSQTQHSLLLKV